MVYYVRLGATNPSYGVYIQDTDGYFLTVDEWNSAAGLTANCIAVILENTRFGIALTGSSDKMEIYDDASIIPDLTGISDKDAAKVDYAGFSNTNRMIAVYGTDITYAAGYCANYSFPKGNKGYLGSVGQWVEVYYNIDAITAALTAAGGDEFSNGYHWSSTLSDEGSDGECTFWYASVLNSYIEGVVHAMPYYSNYVRAFCSL